MSYILDALKKSEQERGTGSIPSVQTIHSSSLNYHQEKRPLWPWILIAVLIVNVAILVYFLKPDANTQDKVSHTNIVEKHSSTISEPENIVVEPPLATIQQSVEIKQPPAVEAPRFSEPENSIQVVDIDELPANIRQQIPGMVFSAHVYSSSPVQRSLVINNRFLEEGDMVDQDLVLREITPTGAIFSFSGYRFSTSVLSGWGTP